MPSWCLKQPGGGKLWSELCPYLTAIMMHYLYYGSTNALFKEHFHKAMAPVMQVKKKRHHKTGKFIMRKINFYTTHHVGTCTSKWNVFSYLTFQTIPYSKVLRILKPDNMSFMSPEFFTIPESGGSGGDLSCDPQAENHCHQSVNVNQHVNQHCEYTFE